MESLFIRLYKYRQRENKSDLENFSTEILAYTLQTDSKFKKDFFELIKCEDLLQMSVSTQQTYPKFGRPDIEIETNETSILIENKVDSLEGVEQLNRYVNILLNEKKQKSKYLIYLTKYYEHKVIVDSQIKYKNIKWWDLTNLITEENQDITKEFKLYLLESKIAMDKNFKNIDLVSLENVANALSKMDEVIDSIKDYFSSKFGGFSKDSSRSTRLKHKAYYTFKSFFHPFQFDINLGYYWWWPDEVIYLGVRVFIPYKASEKNELIDFFRENLIGWKEEPWNKTLTFSTYKPLNEIIATEKEQLPVMINFLKEKIDDLNKLKKIKPDYFK